MKSVWQERDHLRQRGEGLERRIEITFLLAVRASLLRLVGALGSQMVGLIADPAGTSEDSRLGAVGLVMPATTL